MITKERDSFPFFPLRLSTRHIKATPLQPEQKQHEHEQTTQSKWEKCMKTGKAGKSLNDENENEKRIHFITMRNVFEFEWVFELFFCARDTPENEHRKWGEGKQSTAASRHIMNHCRIVVSLVFVLCVVSAEFKREMRWKWKRGEKREEKWNSGG